MLSLFILLFSMLSVFSAFSFAQPIQYSKPIFNGEVLSTLRVNQSFNLHIKLLKPGVHGLQYDLSVNHNLPTSPVTTYPIFANSASALFSVLGGKRGYDTDPEKITNLLYSMEPDTDPALPADPDPNSSANSFAVLNFTAPAVAGVLTFSLNNIVLASGVGDLIPNTGGQAQYMSIQVVDPFDLDSNGTIDYQDLTMLVRLIAGRRANPGAPTSPCDLNLDSRCDVVDIQLLAAKIRSVRP